MTSEDFDDESTEEENKFHYRDIHKEARDFWYVFVKSPEKDERQLRIENTERERIRRLIEKFPKKYRSRTEDDIERSIKSAVVKNYTYKQSELYEEMRIVPKFESYNELRIPHFIDKSLMVYDIFNLFVGRRERTQQDIARIIKYILDSMFIVIDDKTFYKYDGCTQTWKHATKKEFASIIAHVLGMYVEFFKSYYDYRITCDRMTKKYASKQWEKSKKQRGKMLKSIDDTISLLDRPLTTKRMCQYLISKAANYMSHQRRTLRNRLKMNEYLINFSDVTVKFDDPQGVSGKRRQNDEFYLGCTDCNFIYKDDIKPEGKTLFEFAKLQWPEIMNYISDMSLGEQETMENLIVMLFLTILPRNYHKYIIFLYGKGNTSKTTLIEMLYKALGGSNSFYTSQLPSGVLSTQTTSATSHDGKMILVNEGVRFLYMDETSRKTVFDSKRIKEFANGSYEFQVRACGSSDIQIRNLSPTVVIIVNENSIPYISGGDGDEAIINRIIGFKTNAVYVTNSYREAKLAEFDEAIEGNSKDDDDESFLAERGLLERTLLIKDKKKFDLLKTKYADLLSMIVYCGSKLYYQKLEHNEDIFDPEKVKPKELLRKLTLTDGMINRTEGINEWFAENYTVVRDINGNIDESIGVNPTEIKRAYCADEKIKVPGTAVDFCQKITIKGQKLIIRKSIINNYNMTVLGVRKKLYI